MSKTIGLNAPNTATAVAKPETITSAKRRATTPESAAIPQTSRHGKEVRFGDLVLRFTSQFELRWNDQGSGAHADVSFYHPIAPEGFYVLGSIGFAGYSDPNGNVAALCVKPADGLTGKAPLAPPLRYDFIWNDAGSGADRDGACWRPVPPDGYVALGDVFTGGWVPGPNDVMCVAKELTGEGVVGYEIWNDSGSGADRDFGAWQVEVSQAYRDTEDGLFAVNSFVGRDSHDKPSASPVANTLRLPLPTYEGGEVAKPTLDSRNCPPSQTLRTLVRVVTLPFTAVVDNDQTFQWKMENSPFYDVERYVYYNLIIFDDNQTAKDQRKTRAVTTGVTETQTQSFSITTGIKVTYDSGVSAGGFSSKVAVEMSLQLGYMTSTAVAVLRSVQDTAELITPAGCAAALWSEANALRLIRSDDTPVGPSLEFDATSAAYRSSQFPAPASGAASQVRHVRFPSRLRLA